MPPRRSHKKSRAGCRRCKARKIKVCAARVLYSYPGLSGRDHGRVLLARCRADPGAVQCDEVHPRCANCVKHGVACDFEHPAVADELQPVPSASTPRSDVVDPVPNPPPAAPNRPVGAQPPLTMAASASSSSSSSSSLSSLGPLCRPPQAPIVSATTPVTSRLLELKLLHQYTTTTSRTFSFSGPGTDVIWRETVPHVALAGSNHLTDAVLAVAALHLRSIAPSDRDLVRASHAYMASSLREYSKTLKSGINASNAEALFLTSTLIAFQSTATRIFNKDELSLNSANNADSLLRGLGAPGGYHLPLSWFHAFQGVKAITAAAWPWLRRSDVVLPIIDAQPVLQLEFDQARETFFGHLLDDLDEEIAALPPDAASAPPGLAGQLAGASFGSRRPAPVTTLAGSTRQAYEHAVAVLNWAHKIPQRGAPLAFPATVSRRYVELLEERRPRALAILACFFALLKSLDTVWWLQGMARREVLGVVSLFNSDFFGTEVERRWWPHLEWAVRVAVYDDSANPGCVPPEVWGATWLDEDTVLAQRGSETFVSHIELLSQMVSASQSFPAPNPDG